MVLFQIISYFLNLCTHKFRLSPMKKLFLLLCLTSHLLPFPIRNYAVQQTKVLNRKITIMYAWQ